jgi:hypothetical protein
MTFRDSRLCTRRLRSIFPKSSSQKSAAIVINICPWTFLELEPGAIPVAE